MKRGKGTFGSAEQVQKGPDVEDQWGIKRIGYLPLSDENSAWHIADGADKNIVVAVIDSGLDLKHPDGPEFVWTNTNEIPGNNIDDDNNGYVDDVHGFNFVDNNSDLTDLKGHGTFVAGIVAARRNNGEGVAGINPGAVIMPLKVVDKKGTTHSLSIFRAITYAVDHGARVINVSLGGRGITQIEQTALNYAHAHNVFVAVASGNTGEYLGDVAPASLTHAFAVGAFDHDGKLSTISSVGPNNGLLGPGEKIYSIQSQDAPREGGDYDHDRNYHKQSGTSFSTPMVAATASLMLTLNPTLTPHEITDILTGTAKDMNADGWDGKTGAGALDATAALKAVDQEFLNVQINKFDLVYDPDKKKKLIAVDLYGTVRGQFKEFFVEVGRGADTKKFKPIAGPYTEEASSTWIVRIDRKSVFKGIKEWSVRIRVVDNEGDEKTARAFLNLER